MKDISINIASKRIAWGKFLNCGQTCIAPNFVAVHENVKGKFVKSLTKEIITTHGLDPKKSHFYSKIINLNHVERLSKLIKGYDLIHGGKYDRKLNYFEPTILEVKSIKDKILKDEIFGPILPLISYKNDEELNNILIEYKNPLAFYIFSNRLSYAKNIINTYSFGGGAINDILGQIVNKNLPFGGIGNSGIGKYHGYESFKTFSHFKPYIIKSNFFDLSFKYKMSQNSLLFRITKRLLKHISV